MKCPMCGTETERTDLCEACREKHWESVPRFMKRQFPWILLGWVALVMLLATHYRNELASWAKK